MQPMLNVRVLAVDDDPAILDLVEVILEEHGATVVTCADGASAIGRLRADPFHVLLSDLQMEGVDGLGVMEACQQIAPRTVNILMTGHASLDVAVQAMQRNAFDLLQKPMTEERLVGAVHRAQERIRLIERQDLLQSANVVAQSRSPEELPEALLELALRLFSAERAAIVLSRPGRNPSLLHDLHGRRRPPGSLGNLRRLTRAASEQPVRLPEDAEDHPDLSWPEGLKALASPLVAKGEPLGAVCLLRGTEAPGFRRADQARLELFSIQLSMAVSQMALVGSLRKRVADLERARRHAQRSTSMAELGTEALELAHALLHPTQYVQVCLRQASRQLEGAQPAAELLDAGISGEGGLEELRKHKLSQRFAATRKELDAAMERLRHIEELAQEFAALATGRVSREIDLEEAVAKAAAAVKIKVKSEVGGLHVKGHPAQLHRALVEVLDNARIAIRGMPHGRVVARAEAEGDEVHLRIVDNGPGFPLRLIASATEAYVSTRKSSGATGMGLYTASQMVEAQDGKLVVEAGVSGGASIRISLPVADAAVEEVFAIGEE